MRKLLRKLLLGITLPTEYVTARRGDLPATLKTVSTDGNPPVNVLFLGYKNSLLGIVNTIANGKNDAYAIRSFAMVNSRNEAFGLFSGCSGPAIPLGENQVTLVHAGCREQLLESGIHQTNARIINAFRKRRAGNIDLTKPEYDFLKLQYSIPREIRVAVVSDGENYNLFPIDLFGFAGDEYMILSLRHAMNSCTQLESTGQLATWIMNADAAAEVYAMGSNHSAAFLSAGELPFSGQASPVFGFPRPMNALDVEEFEFVQRIQPDYHHHRLFILKRVGRKAEIHENSLVHIHRTYAESLLKQGFPLKQISR